jgi:hypothetical protein
MEIHTDRQRWLKHATVRDQMIVELSHEYGSDTPLELASRIARVSQQPGHMRSGPPTVDEALGGLAATAAARDEADYIEACLIRDARSARVPWARIADALGLNSAQAAQARWAARRHLLEPNNTERLGPTMSYALICIPDTELRDQVAYMFHNRGYRVVASPTEGRADEEVIATVDPGQMEVLTSSHRLPRGGTISVTETVRFDSLRVDIGDYQLEMDPPHVFDNAEQFVGQIIGFAECPGEFLDEAA